MDPYQSAFKAGYRAGLADGKVSTVPPRYRWLDAPYAYHRGYDAARAAITHRVTHGSKS